MYAHVGFLARGHIRGEYADGCAFEFIAPQVVVVEPGHDAWVVGDEAAVRIQFDAEAATASLFGLASPESGGSSDAIGLGNTTVRLKLLDEPDFSHSARMDFVDNVIDRATGTIRGRAQLDNAQGLFTPGMFARVQVPASAPYEALMVPDVAIGTEQARKYVYVIDQENIARLRYVTLGQLVGDLRVIKDGVSAADRVVVNGLMRVRQGQKVTPEEQSASPQASVPAAKTTDKTD